MGSEEVTLAAAEHACSAPKPKWSAKQSAKCTCSTDTPEGVVVELKVGVPVQPFSCSGTLRDKTARDLMGAQLGKRIRQKLG